ncbi:Hypothetical predicted protein [Paramuricea clavata]|uniref:Uncharacterized protein n=1 Tax=Paramuricea clavata TaxID=317549 RepID=A0A6S7H185_PARCT|nr:Hypothetical predicted protein [Paramuricea clavata]
MASVDEDDLTDLDDLEKSFDELKLLECEETLTSTPVKRRPCKRNILEDINNTHSESSELITKKHALTPESKASGLPARKRTMTGCSLNAREIHSRHEVIYSRLCEGFEEKMGSVTNQTALLEYLNLDENDKSLLTRAVKAVFPGANLRRIRKKNYPEMYLLFIIERYQYHNVGAKTNFWKPEYFDNDEAEINSIKMKINASKEVMEQIWVQLSDKLQESPDMITLAEQYARESFEHDKYVHEQKKLLNEEVRHLRSLNKFKDLRKSDIGVRHDLITPDLFNAFCTQVNKEKCPLIDSILETICTTANSEKNVRKTNELKFKCASHALASLLHIRSSKDSTDFLLLFGLLCISYGAGKQFVNMLNAIGLSLHWNTIMKFLDQRLNNFTSIIKEKFPADVPVILLMDNINIHIEENTDTTVIERYQYHNVGAKTNFWKPEYFDNDEDNHPEHMKLWNDFRDQYFLQLLQTGLNCIPQPDKDFATMTEEEFLEWLKKQTVEGVQVKENFVIQVADVLKPSVDSSYKSSDVVILPLSVEDNSTINGTASILEEFGKEFGIDCNHQTSFLLFDENKKVFDLKASRNRYEFITHLEEHKKTMLEYKSQLDSTENDFEHNSCVF